MRNFSEALSFAILLLLVSCTENQSIPEAFLGTWQSDEALTLASLRESDAVSPADLEIFADKFFGDNVIIFREFEVGGYPEGAGYELGFSPYDIVDSGDDFMILRYPANIYNEEIEQSWHIEGDLIYAYIEKWQFKEYFRRIGGK